MSEDPDGRTALAHRRVEPRPLIAYGRIHPSGLLGDPPLTRLFPKCLPAHPPLPVYRRWMAKVLQPLNEKAAQIATDNIDLLEGSTIEPLLLQVRGRGMVKCGG